MDRVADALRPVTDTLLVVANDPQAGTWLPGVPHARDRFPGAGGLAGVDAALHWKREGDVLVVAWDMPFVSTALLRALVAGAAETGADVSLPESPSPYGFEPFCAFYSRRVADSLAEFLEGGGGAARDFIRRLARVHRLDGEAVRAIGDPATLFLSVNTPADLDRARAIAAATQ